MPKTALTFPTLKACLIAREPVYLAQAEKLRLQFDARVADADDWLKDYQLRLDVKFCLREDGPDYDEDSDNIIVEVTFDMRDPFEIVDGVSHIYNCLRTDPLLSAEMLNRIGFVWADIVLVVREGIAHPPTDIRGLNAVLRDIDARYTDPKTNLAAWLIGRQADPADWLADHEVEFDVRYFTQLGSRAPISDPANRMQIAMHSSSLTHGCQQPDWGPGHSEQNFAHRPEHDIGENISYLYAQLWSAIDFPDKETDIDYIEVELMTMLQEFSDIVGARVDVPSATPAIHMGGRLHVAFGPCVESGPNFPMLYGATWNRNFGVVMAPVRSRLDGDRNGGDARNAEDQTYSKLFSEVIPRKRRDPIRMTWFAGSASDANSFPVLAEGFVVLGSGGIKGHFEMLETLEHLMKRFDQPTFLFKSYDSLNLELHRHSVIDGVFMVTIGQWLPASARMLLEIWRRENGRLTSTPNPGRWL